MKTQGYLGIDAGTQGLSVIFTDTAQRILAHGESRYEMVSDLGPECYEQRPADWERALEGAMADLRHRLATEGIDMEVLAIGISAQMHGEVLADEEGRTLAPARLWCDGRNEAEGHELTNRFGVKMPKRITAARWLWTTRNRPALAARTARITTPSGWIAHLLTGGWVLGIGDAAGMFPIDQSTGDYDRRRLADFDTFSPDTRPLSDLLPKVRRAGEDGGTLDARGARLLGLPAGVPVAPAEGDQPAALTGSLIGAAGMVAMSFGTSVVANSVGDRSFQGVSRGVDHFCAPDGKPINMVWLRNGTTPMNTVVALFGGVHADDTPNAFAAVIPQLLAAPPDCGGLLALPFTDDEPGLGVSRGGTACVIGLNDRNATPGNVARAMLMATIFNLRIGSAVLDAQGFPRTEIVLSGGLTKTPELGQLVADAFATPVTILDGATEGTAWGAALLAEYRHLVLARRAPDWVAFLGGHASGTPRRFRPRPPAASACAAMYDRYRRLVALHGDLESAVDAHHSSGR